MGGYLSTRWNWHTTKQTINAAPLVLRSADLRKLLNRSPERTISAEGHVSKGQARGFRVWTTVLPATQGSRTLELSFRIGWGGDAPPTDVLQRIRAVMSPQPFGGDPQWFLLCPLCDKRRRALYIVPVAHRFGCRVCYRLSYPSQRVNRQERLWQKVRHDAAFLGWDVERALEGILPSVRDKPSGMSRARYWRLTGRLATSVAEYWSNFNAEVERRFGGMLGRLRSAGSDK